MNDAFSQLFDLETLRFGAEGVRFGFAREFPAWLWALAAGAAAAFAWATYARLAVRRRVRLPLAGLRAALLVLLLVLAAGPQLSRQNEREEQDWVVVLIDRSQSLTVPDAPGRTTRDAQLTRALDDALPMWRALDASRRLLVLGFDADAYELEPSVDSADVMTGFDLSSPEGSRTALGASIESALRRVAARPVAGLVVLTDGRSADALPRSARRRLDEELIPVFTVPLGSAEAPTDLAVARVEAPSAAFVGDRVPVRAVIERRGDADTPIATARLIDQATGITLDERTIRPGDYDESGRVELSLLTRPEDPGEADWAVELEPVGGDLVSENNAEPVTLNLVDRPLRVLYLDGYPRWEFRYVKNLLLRERSIDSSNLLVATDRRYLQEGDTIIDTLPDSPEEWAGYDVVVLGDLRAELFSERQLEHLREHVALRGAGLLWIAGTGATPGTWFDSPMADLLPFRQSTGAEPGVRAWGEPVTMAPTDLARERGLLALGSGAAWPTALADPESGWSTLRFAQRVDPEALKPGTEVLAAGVPLTASFDAAERVATHPRAAPLVLSMRYGAGRVVYVGTDEVWRWRYARGETLTERFWLPIVRALGRAAVERGGRAALLEVGPDAPVVRTPVRIGVTLLDQALLDAAPSALRVRVSPEGAAPGERVELTLAPSGDAAGRAFETTWVPTQPGVYVVEPADPLLAGLGMRAEIDAAAPGDELRTPQADHTTLTDLAESTGGAVLEPSTLDQLPASLPNRSVVIAAAPDIETLWDRPPALALLVLLLAFEWVARRFVRLA